MKFLRHLLGTAKLGQERNESIKDNLCVCVCVRNTVQETEQCQQKWLQHIKRMHRNGLCK